MASQQGSAAPTAAALGTENAPNGSHITFVIPPPVTFFMQLNDGVQVTFTPQPTPLVMGLPGLENVAVMVPGLLNQLLGGTGANGAQDEGGMMRVLHELFMQAQQQSHGPPPTSRSFLDKLPIKVWSDQVKACERQDECPICLSDFESNDQVISLPCGHLYHKECGLQWLVEHNVCPTCRYKLPTQQEEASTPATSATPEPPAAPQPNTSSNTQSTEQSPRVSRTRPRSPVISPVRVVRRRVGEVNEPTPEPTSETSSSSSIDDATLEIMLEEEAERFVAEERQTEQTSVMDVDSAMDQGVESLLQNNCNDTTK